MKMVVSVSTDAAKAFVSLTNFLSGIAAIKETEDGMELFRKAIPERQWITVHPTQKDFDDWRRECQEVESKKDEIEDWNSYILILIAALANRGYRVVSRSLNELVCNPYTSAKKFGDISLMEVLEAFFDNGVCGSTLRLESVRCFILQDTLGMESDAEAVACIKKYIAP